MQMANKAKDKRAASWSRLLLVISARATVVIYFNCLRASQVCVSVLATSLWRLIELVVVRKLCS